MIAAAQFDRDQQVPTTGDLTPTIPLREAFIRRKWSNATFEELEHNGFSVRMVDDEPLLVWKGCEQDAEAFSRLLHIDNSSTLLDLASGEDADAAYRLLLYGNNDPISVATPPGDCPLRSFYSREKSILVNMPTTKPEGCKLTAIDHIVCMPGSMSTKQLRHQVYTRLVAWLAAPLHDIGKIIDPLNGDHDTISAEMAKTLLTYCMKQQEKSTLLTPQIRQDVVDVIGMHHFAAKTSWHSLRQADFDRKKNLSSDKKTLDGVENWTEMGQKIKELMADLDFPVDCAESQLSNEFSLFDFADRFRPLFELMSTQSHDLSEIYSYLTQSGYARLAEQYDTLYETHLLEILQTLLSSYQRVQVLYLLTLADLQSSDRCVEDLNKFRRESELCFAGVVLSLDTAAEKLALARSYWFSDESDTASQ